MVNCSGKLDWASRNPEAPQGKREFPSAVCDGNRVFVFFKSSTLAALDLDGNILWKTNLKSYGEISYFWDMGSSPVLADDKVIIPVMHEGDSYILALDKVSGEEAWKIGRNYKCNVESAQSYTTPIVVKMVKLQG